MNKGSIDQLDAIMKNEDLRIKGIALEFNHNFSAEKVKRISNKVHQTKDYSDFSSIKSIFIDKGSILIMIRKVIQIIPKGINKR